MTCLARAWRQEERTAEVNAHGIVSIIDPGFVTGNAAFQRIPTFVWCVVSWCGKSRALGMRQSSDEKTMTLHPPMHMVNDYFDPAFDCLECKREREIALIKYDEKRMTMAVEPAPVAKPSCSFCNERQPHLREDCPLEPAAVRASLKKARENKELPEPRGVVKQKFR